MGLFGGDTSSAQSQSSGVAALNSSGWVVGKGSANGGTLETNSGAGLPWYAWASFAIVALAYWRKKKRG